MPVGGSPFRGSGLGPDRNSRLKPLPRSRLKPFPRSRLKRLPRILIAVAAIAAVVVVLRVAAPEIIERYVNRELADMGDYRGSVADVDLALLRGGYTLRDVSIVKEEAATTTPFAAMPTMDLSLQWRALMRGRAVGEIIMDRPVVNLVQAESDEETQLGTGVRWPDEIRDLFPFRLNLVQVRDGLVTFRAPGIETDDSLTVRNFRLALRNLTNVEDVEEGAFAELELDGRVMGNAPLHIEGRLDPNEEIATFDINLSLEGGRLVDVNPWLREFIKVDAEAGVFSMFAELAAADGRFEGYIRPIMENPELFDADEDTSGPFRKAWEALVGVAAKILENRRQDQVATQIPFAGEIEDPQAGIVATLVNLLRNAFVAAFAHSLEGSVSLRDVAQDVTCLNADQEEPEQEDC